MLPSIFRPFFLNDTATTEIYTLSLHDALPISRGSHRAAHAGGLHGSRCARTRIEWFRREDFRRLCGELRVEARRKDRKSTRLNSRHVRHSYAVFCLTKKKVHLHSAHIYDDVAS